MSSARSGRKRAFSSCGPFGSSFWTASASLAIAGGAHPYRSSLRSPPGPCPRERLCRGPHSSSMREAPASAGGLQLVTPALKLIPLVAVAGLRRRRWRRPPALHRPQAPSGWRGGWPAWHAGPVLGVRVRIRDRWPRRDRPSESRRSSGDDGRPLFAGLFGWRLMRVSFASCPWIAANRRRLWPTLSPPRWVFGGHRPSRPLRDDQRARRAQRLGSL